ncbi:MAG: shikimate dehydrogenase, partial [Clostridia bacterium]|nr:shikimate dehydrogenase [Clostridia bacterium]
MKFGLLGEKLGHSFSPDIHKRLLTSDYVLKEVPRDGLDDFLKKRDFSAINVTIPYKQAVIPYLHYISDKAREIGAVNVVVNKDGLLYGYNTDFFGLKGL